MAPDEANEKAAAEEINRLKPVLQEIFATAIENAKTDVNVYGDLAEVQQRLSNRIAELEGGFADIKKVTKALAEIRTDFEKATDRLLKSATKAIQDVGQHQARVAEAVRKPEQP